MNGYYLMMGICPPTDELRIAFKIPILHQSALLLTTCIQERVPVRDWVLTNHIDKYCYCLVLDQPDELLARDITRALLATHRVMVGDLPYDLEYYTVPATMVGEDHVVELAELIEFNRSLRSEHTLDDVQLALMLGSGRVVNSQVAQQLCLDVGSVIQKGLVDACENLATSKEEFELLPDDVRDLEEGVLTPDDFAKVAKEMDSSFMKAYRTIESIIGDPSSDLNKIKGKLSESGLDPETSIRSHSGETTLAAAILRFRRSRKDKAHGWSWILKKRVKVTNPLEVKDIQGVAKTMLLLCIRQEQKNNSPQA